jgi:hypothetical protein
MRRNIDIRICTLRLGEEDFKHILLDCFETRNWRTKFLNGEWLSTNKEVDYSKI